jgi:hypothetical protein
VERKRLRRRRTPASRRRFVAGDIGGPTVDGGL